VALSKVVGDLQPGDRKVILNHLKIPSLKLTFCPENRPGPKRKRSYSNYPFSGVNSLLVSGRVGFGEIKGCFNTPPEHTPGNPPSQL